MRLHEQDLGERHLGVPAGEGHAEPNAVGRRGHRRQIEAVAREWFDVLQFPTGVRDAFAFRAEQLDSQRTLKALRRLPAERDGDLEMVAVDDGGELRLKRGVAGFARRLPPKLCDSEGDENRPNGADARMTSGAHDGFPIRHDQTS